MFEIIEDAPLRACLEFIVKADALKKVLRKTSVIKNERQENTAEHSWHLTLMALVLQNYANDRIQVDKVIKMLILHDLGEIEVGDVFFYDSGRVEAKNLERSAIDRLFASLPQGMREEFVSLWEEFTEGTTAEACYARALDRFQPFLSNVANNGGSWKSMEVSKNKALAKNCSIAEGSAKLWQIYQLLAEEMEEKGCFYKSA